MLQCVLQTKDTRADDDDSQSLQRDSSTVKQDCNSAPVTEG